MRLNIVMVSGFDVLGIQVNGYLLHKYLRQRGHDSKMYVHAKFSDDPDVRPLTNRVLSRLNRLAQIIQTKLDLWTILPVEGASVLVRRTVRRADIVHLQLIHNAQFFSVVLVMLLSWLRPMRLVLSVHDMFMTTGHCVYSLDCERWKTGCGKCPNKDTPFPIRRDTSRVSWWIKRVVFRAARLHLLVGSPWQRQMVANSPILRHLPVHYIPYGVDTRVFRPRNQSACRRQFGIPEDAHVLSFRSAPFSRNFKGTEELIEALERYSPTRETHLLVFEGVGGLERLEDKYKINYLGWTNDGQLLISQALNAADVFLMPSTAEAFGLMAIESLACKTPVIVFEGTALQETIKAPVCGLAVPMRDTKALADAVDRLLNDSQLRHRMAQAGVRHAFENHNFEDYADRHIALYETILSGARD